MAGKAVTEKLKTQNHRAGALDVAAVRRDFPFSTRLSTARNSSTSTTLPLHRSPSPLSIP